MTRVLLAEDDPAISEPLARALRREGYDVDVRADGRAALDGATENPDLVVLDLGLPHVDGLEVCRRIRAEGRTIPVLILTARADEVDTVVGPRRRRRRLRHQAVPAGRAAGPGAGAAAAQPRRRRPTSDELVRIDPEGRRAWFKDEELQLTAKEFDLLRVLVREQGKVVSREQLMREIWETAWFGSTKTLDMHISVLRRKLGDDAAQPRYIATVRGVGFRFERRRPGSDRQRMRQRLVRSTVLAVALAVLIIGAPVFAATWYGVTARDATVLRDWLEQRHSGQHVADAPGGRASRCRCLAVAVGVLVATRQARRFVDAR